MKLISQLDGYVKFYGLGLSKVKVDIQYITQYLWQELILLQLSLVYHYTVDHG